MRRILFIFAFLAVGIPQAIAIDCPDDDGDGYTRQDCGGEDCNDEDADIHPGVSELANDGVDQDCDGFDLTVNCDQDGDGVDALACGGQDCNDLDETTYPGANDPSGDGIDQDCSGDGACEPAVWVQGPRYCGTLSTMSLTWLPLAALLGLRRRREA